MSIASLHAMVEYFKRLTVRFLRSQIKLYSFAITIHACIADNNKPSLTSLEITSYLDQWVAPMSGPTWSLRVNGVIITKVIV